MKLEKTDQIMKKSFTILMLLASFNALSATPQCSSEAVTQAKKLLSFHVDGDDRAEVAPRVKQLPSLANPANKAQKLTVLEVMGFVYKGEYRMRFIYHPIGKDCLLIGQEILELSDL